ncbi:inosine-5'-monophosphate dehydrogenase [Salinisphaera hydrothermalis C41B8]|uniref:Inosine-5'-monophosphate dehydrogenase n=1 Tax=Salinisphaera hydrothermalis (strain C41B8) TaxID=1304275 RepID=A0A084IHE5_SALHC|nr:IMP dehydrogenase [Salinisphaera hydrothermalis]KEZ76129.1 inosine-5'-monophosphate dehydrogenase [Salinisphaera hydrothermalis C41B8]
MTLRISEQALTFDDVLLQPAYSDVLPRQVDLSTRLTRGITLNIPLVSAAMDTVTEAGLAIALAQEGGIGIIHKSMSAEKQAQHVRTVKKYESGVISDPITVGPDATIREVLDLTRAQGISGVPVVDNGAPVGIVTSRDLRFETRFDAPVTSVMTPREKLVTVHEGASRDEILGLFHTHRIEKVLVVNGDFALRGMITVKDIQKSTDFPNACKDAAGSLRVGAAVGPGPDAFERVQALVNAGVDVVVVDTAHGHSSGVLSTIKELKQRFPELQLIGGNVGTAEGARALVDAGADAVKVGIGPGSICTTRIVAGIGVPQISAVANVVAELSGTDVPVIADGGIRFSGDLAKALVAGAHATMIGGMFAGTEEAPGEIELYQGRSFKAYRGMGSLGAMSGSQGSADRYFQDPSEEIQKLVPEGIEGRVPYKGPLGGIVHQLIGGLRAAMGYTGCHNITEMRTKPTFVQITSAGMKESHVHDVNITKEAPNYRVD